MSFRTVILTVIMLLVCPVGWSQTKTLGDVAGAIKLNPEAIVEKQGVVEDPRAAKQADENLLGSVLADCSAAADLLGELVAEARLPAAKRDIELAKRIESASFELETEVHSVSLLRLGREFAPVLETAREAEEICTAAGARVRSEIAQGGVMFRNAETEVTRCRQILDRAKTELVTIEKPAAPPAAAPETSPEEQSPTDDDIIAARCEPERTKGAGAVESCRAVQYLSQAAMASRNPDNEMLDEGVFSDIRQVCLDLHPRDFVQRDACEQEKMTAARLEAE